MNFNDFTWKTHYFSLDVVLILRNLWYDKTVKKRNLILLFCLFILCLGSNAQVLAQTQFFGTPTPPAAEKKPETPAPAAGGAAAGTKGGGAVASGTKPVKRGFTVPVYDPYMDNHLSSPVKKIGLFGEDIRDVEKTLKKYGAKSYSYAFGKYSRMSFSIYLVTMYFDKARKLGGVSISPKLPYKKVEPGAKSFFLELFLGKNDISEFRTLFADDRLELRYFPKK
jgi:hypothetical protein